jgi:hypothetical protein
LKHISSFFNKNIKSSKTNKIRTFVIVRRTPELVVGAPELVGGTPDFVGGTPELVGGTPELVGGTPELVRGTPELVRGTPELVRNTLGDFPQTLTYQESFLSKFNPGTSLHQNFYAALNAMPAAGENELYFSVK